MQGYDRRYKIKNFDGTNYFLWRMQVKNYLYQKDLHEPIFGFSGEKAKDEKNKVLDPKALGVV